MSVTLPYTVLGAGQNSLLSDGTRHLSCHWLFLWDWYDFPLKESGKNYKNQSIKINQNQPINQSVSHSVGQSVGHSVSQSVSQQADTHGVYLCVNTKVTGNWKKELLKNWQKSSIS